MTSLYRRHVAADQTSPIATKATRRQGASIMWTLAIGEASRERD